MDPSLYSRGVLIGFSIAAPVGPIGVLCIRRTLASGRWVGLATGLGAATADAAYGAIAAGGITVLTLLLLHYQRAIRLAGGLFLCFLAGKTLRSQPAAVDAAPTGSALVQAYTSSVALTLTNPSTILSFIAIFAGLGAGSLGHGGWPAVALVLGVLSGSALWWVVLTTVVAAVRTSMTGRHVRWVNRLSGSILLGFGLLALAGVAGL